MKIFENIKPVDVFCNSKNLLPDDEKNKNFSPAKIISSIFPEKIIRQVQKFYSGFLSSENHTLYNISFSAPVYSSKFEISSYFSGETHSIALKYCNTVFCHNSQGEITSKKLSSNHFRSTFNHFRFTSNHFRSTGNDSQFTGNDSRFTGNDSRLTRNSSQLTRNSSRLTGSSTRLIGRDTQFTGNGSQTNFSCNLRNILSEKNQIIIVQQ